MKTITKTLAVMTAFAAIGISTANAQCVANYTWSQTVSNVIDYTNTSSPIIPNQTNFIWSFGDSQYDYSENPSHTYASPGTYYVCVTIIDSLSPCANTFCDTVIVWGNVLPTNCSANFTVVPDSSNTSQAWAYNYSQGGPGMTYDWNWGDNTPHDYVAYPSHIYLNTGTYNICLIVTDTANQCADTMCVSLTVYRLTQQAASAPYYVNVIPTGIHELAQVTWSLYPNPAQHEINIKSDYTLTGNVYRVLDISGRTAVSGKLDGTTIDVSTLDKGMYILQIENNKGGFTSQRFMKD
ncbi:hypothetical protein BH09BAC5_BH09BAC5_18100 [soil metagenome]